MNNRRILKALLIFAVGGVLLASTLGYLYLRRDESARITALNQRPDFVEPGSVPIGGPFTLVDHTGKTVTDEEFRGKYLLVFFGFSNCPDVCPTTLADIARTLDLLGKDARVVQPLFISVDPERDTPKRLAEYVKAFHPRIVGLTGSLEQVREVTKAYRTFYEKISADEYYGRKSDGNHEKTDLGDDYMISHQGNTYLMSLQGAYLTHFRYGTGAETMAGKIRKAFAKFGTSTKGRN